MPTKIILLEDGTRVEVEAALDEVEKISGGRLKPIQDATIEKIKPILSRVVAACDEIRQDMNIEQAEIDVGLCFEGEGNIYITKSKASANLSVKLTLKPKKGDE